MTPTRSDKFPVADVPRRGSDRAGPDYRRLVDAVMTARRALTGFMMERQEAVKQFAGNHYGGYGNFDNTHKQPVNLLSKFVTALSRKLVARDPKVSLQTFDPKARPTVSKMQAWANKKLQALGIAATFQRQTVDALFCLGVVKVCLVDPGLAAASGWARAAGEPAAWVVDLDDFAVDLTAHSWEECGFVGNKYRVPLEVARDFGRFDKRERQLLTPRVGSNWTERGTERADALGPGTTVTMEGYEDMVDLWEVYLPRHRTVVTLPCDESGNPVVGKNPLREQRFVGPDRGPYHAFQFDPVPGNLIGKSPVMDLVDLDWWTNENYRKVARQASRSKTFGMVRGGADADGNRIVRVSDGEVMKVDDPSGYTEVTTGGADPKVMAVAEHFRDLFSFVAGNMNAWAGLEAQSKTATQDRMLSASASEMVADMQAAAVANVKSVAGALCWYWWHDPYQTMRHAEPVPGLPGAVVTRTLSPEQRREVPWDELEFSVNPFSVLPQTPQQQAAALKSVVVEEVIPLLPLLQAKGYEFDAGKYMKARAELLDLPVLAELLEVGDVPQPDAEGGGRPEPPRKPPTSTRYYDRTSTGPDTQANRANRMMGVLSGKSSSNGAMPRSR